MRFLVFVLKSAILLALFLLAEWSFSAFLGGVVQLRIHLLLLLSALFSLPESAQWQLLRLPEWVSRLLIHSLLVLAFGFLLDNSFLTAAYAFYNLLIFFVTWILREGKKENLVNFAVSLVSTGLMLLLIEFASPSIQTWVITQQHAANEAQAAAVPAWADIQLAPQEHLAASSPITEV